MVHLMATGYVHDLIDKKQTFPEFAISCARAFGALVTMREEPNDAKIPDKFVPSPYHKKALAEAKATLKTLLKMTPAQKVAYGKRIRDKEISRLEETVAIKSAECTRCLEILEDVRKWKPPTPEHQGLKNFMIEQLRSSMKNVNCVYERESIKELRAKSVEDFVQDAIDDAKSDIEYHAKKMAEEKERCQSRTEWVQQLRKSLK